MNILVVDDDEIALTIANKILRSDKQEIFLAENGQVAKEILQKNLIQIVISDWNMPNMDGIELCRYLRSQPSIGYIYFIMVTSRNSKQDMLAGLEAGADDFISKPFEPAELLLRVRNAQRVLSFETTSVTLFSLARLAESKDTDTGKHLERIREYSKILASQLTMGPGNNGRVYNNFSELIFQTSPLHDIGKVGIPDHVLLKPGQLNDDEWKIMKRHAEIGAKTLDDALDKFPGAEFLRMARDIAWSHHERWDGSGYPRNLKGDEIPLSARIVALADVYDALTMKRVYKSALSHEVARGIILDSSDVHFDPRVVQAFLDTEDQFISIRETFREDCSPI
jgi:putative two-component system response regulator